MYGSPMADLGKPVYAVANGIVRFSGFNSTQGNIIMVEHHLPDGSTVWSQYAHLQQRWVAEGEIVGRRQIIGTVGRGPTTPFHLTCILKSGSNIYRKTAGPHKRPGLAQIKVLEYYADPTVFINPQTRNLTCLLLPWRII